MMMPRLVCRMIRENQHGNPPACQLLFHEVMKLRQDNKQLRKELEQYQRVKKSWWKLW